MIMPMQTKNKRNQRANQRTNISRSQWEHKAKIYKLLKRGKTRVTNSQLVVAFHLIGWNNGTSYLDQSRSKAKRACNSFHCVLTDEFEVQASLGEKFVTCLE